ncbi:MAG: GvpL/GvpF family gas vesicle protein, partial [Gemmatimonadetes bacterium]|nr:GvpL/GvpF family gas vesicle protein [Gemmatimonadota bacterium]
MAPHPSDSAEPGGKQGMYFYGVTRARGWRPVPLGRSDEEAVVRVRYRDIEALVRPVAYEVPPLDEEHVQAHQRAVERAMRRGTVLPAPYGIVFAGRRQLIRMLQDQYLVFDEGL